MAGEVHDLGDVSCPTCGKSAEAATGLTSDAAPRSGDVTVCFYCASVLQFVTIGGPGNPRTSLSVPSPEHKKALMEQSSELRDAVTAIMRKRGMI